MKKKKRNIRSITTAALIAAMGIAPAVSAMPTYAATTAVQGGKTTFDKYLVMKKNANVPNATFSYTVSIPTDAEMTSLPNPEDTNETNLTIRKGIGNPTVSDTTFAAGDQTYDSVQSVRTNKSSTAYDAKTEDQVDGLDGSHKYAKRTSEVDFSSVTYSEPGVYRYKITENDITGEKAGFTKDSTPRYLDVYVESDNSGKLSITGYVFHTANSQQAKGSTTGSNNPDGKNKGFTNKYETHDLTLTKNVTGNQGFRDQYFKFHVNITNLDAGARLFLTDSAGSRTAYESGNEVAYAYNASTGTRTAGQKRFVMSKGTISDVSKMTPYTYASSASGTTGKIITETKGTETDTNVPEDAKGLAVTADANGNVEFDVYLKHSETLKVNGLTAEAKYTITETSEDYSASATKTSGTNAAAKLDLTHAVSKTNNNNTSTDATAEQTLGTVDDTVAYTNNREGVLPTGVIHNNRAALSIAGIAAAGACIAIAVKKQRKNKEKAQKESNQQA